MPTIIIPPAMKMQIPAVFRGMEDLAYKELEITQSIGPWHAGGEMSRWRRIGECSVTLSMEELDDTRHTYPIIQTEATRNTEHISDYVSMVLVGDWVTREHEKTTIIEEEMVEGLWCSNCWRSPREMGPMRAERYFYSIGLVRCKHCKTKLATFDGEHEEGETYAFSSIIDEKIVVPVQEAVLGWGIGEVSAFYRKWRDRLSEELKEDLMMAVFNPRRERFFEGLGVWS